MDKRFLGSIIAAIAVHSAAVAFLASRSVPSGDAPTSRASSLIEVELAVQPSSAYPPAPLPQHGVSSADPVPSAAPLPVPIARAPRTGTARELTTDDPAAEPGASAQSVIPPSPSASGALAPRPPGTINLGLGRDMAWAWVKPPTAQEAHEAAKPRPLSTSGGLIEALDARDRRAGLGFGGAAVSALSAAGRSGDAPATGEATFEATFDSNGHAVAVHLVSFSSDSRGWSSVASHALSALRARPIRVPQGSRGIVVTLRVQATDTLPSGADRRVALQGAGAEFDLSDIGARSMRKVHVHIIGERRL